MRQVLDLLLYNKVASENKRLLSASFPVSGIQECLRWEVLAQSFLGVKLSELQSLEGLNGLVGPLRRWLTHMAGWCWLVAGGLSSLPCDSHHMTACFGVLRILRLAFPR